MAAATSSTGLNLNAVLHGASESTWSTLPGLTARVPKRRNAQASRLSMEMPRRWHSPPSSRIPPSSAASPARSPDSNSNVLAAAAAAKAGETAQGKAIHGKCFVVEDNIDTDQIIPAEYLTLVPSKPDEYEKLGSYAMIGLPARYGKFIEDGKMKSEYSVLIGGANFGCGSSREHAPVALGAAGVRVVVAESFARIFFRNSVATGELYPVETDQRIIDRNKTGDVVTVDMERDVLINHTSGEQFSLVPIGDAGPVIDAGGIFNFARASGMIASASPA